MAWKDHACSEYSRPKGVMGGPCLNCGRSQPDHAAAATRSMSSAPMSDEQLIMRLRACASTVVFNKDTFRAAREAMDQGAARIADYAEVHADKQRLVRVMDHAINGDKAAKQASLCDLVDDVSRLAMRERRSTDLVRRIIKAMSENIHSRKDKVARHGIPLWAIVSDRFALGSTSAKDLVRAHGFDPDKLVRKSPP